MIRHDCLPQAPGVDVEQDSQAALRSPDRERDPEPAHRREDDREAAHQHQRGHRQCGKAEDLSEPSREQTGHHYTRASGGEEDADLANARMEAVARKEHELRPRRTRDEVHQRHHQRDVAQYGMAEDVAKTFDDVMQDRRRIFCLTLRRRIEASANRRQ